MWNGVHHVNILVLRCSGRAANRVIVIRERAGSYSQIEYEQSEETNWTRRRGHTYFVASFLVTEIAMSFDDTRWAGWGKRR